MLTGFDRPSTRKTVDFDFNFKVTGFSTYSNPKYSPSHNMTTSRYMAAFQIGQRRSISIIPMAHISEILNSLNALIGGRKSSRRSAQIARAFRKRGRRLSSYIYGPACLSVCCTSALRSNDLRCTTDGKVSGFEIRRTRMSGRLIRVHSKVVNETSCASRKRSVARVSVARVRCGQTI